MKPAAVGLRDEGGRCWEEEVDERRRCGVAAAAAGSGGGGSSSGEAAARSRCHVKSSTKTPHAQQPGRRTLAPPTATTLRTVAPAAAASKPQSLLQDSLPVGGFWRRWREKKAAKKKKIP